MGRTVSKHLILAALALFAKEDAKFIALVDLRLVKGLELIRALLCSNLFEVAAGKGRGNGLYNALNGGNATFEQGLLLKNRGPNRFLTMQVNKSKSSRANPCQVKLSRIVKTESDQD